ncbi:hypothetical protein H238_0976 [Klebsiella pneumoniae UHKPC179]|nr:hypothetical protein CSC13_4503 [Klebsiella pneumoniae]EPA89097.1 hypothetical protein H237_1000 [Klebsiella pneumoniae UHKPC57]EPO98311.1 hypothetical protein H238_0976 [Klebsiella pneumoniae UHKPC179]CDL16828.1 hypothetical protein [Klebsiella pneumoniae IS46]BBE63024.1 hypothetical protein TRKP064_3930 [Klebsiella pneumoniae]
MAIQHHEITKLCIRNTKVVGSTPIIGTTSIKMLKKTLP